MTEMMADNLPEDRDARLELAISAAQDLLRSGQRAMYAHLAERYQVPTSTLYHAVRRVEGIHNQKLPKKAASKKASSKPTDLLTVEQEKQLARFIANRIRNGNTPNQDEIMQKIVDIQVRNFETVIKAPTPQWLQGFYRRHLELRGLEKEADKQAELARNLAYKASVPGFYEKLKSVYGAHAITDSAIFAMNSDYADANDLYDPPLLRVKVIETLCADGTAMSPTYLCHSRPVVEPIVSGTFTQPHYLVVDECDLTTKTALRWLKTIFLPHLKERREKKAFDHAVLILEANRLYGPAFLKLCEKHDITPVFFPAGEIACKPSEAYVLKRMDRLYSQEIARREREFPDRDMTDVAFVTLFNSIFWQAYQPNDIINGFKATKIWPLDTNAAASSTGVENQPPLQ